MGKDIYGQQQSYKRHAADQQQEPCAVPDIRVGHIVREDHAQRKEGKAQDRTDEKKHRNAVLVRTNHEGCERANSYCASGKPK